MRQKAKEKAEFMKKILYESQEIERQKKDRMLENMAEVEVRQ